MQSLRSDFVALLLSSFLYGASQWAVLAAIAKLGNSEMVGSFALGLAVSAPIMLLCDLKLRSVLASDARGEFSFREYLGVRITTVLIGVLLTALVAQRYDRRTAALIVLIGVAKGFESLSDVTYGLLQLSDRIKRLALSQGIKGPLSILCVAVALHSSGSVVYAGLGLALAWGMLFVFFDLPYALRLSAARTWNEPASGRGRRALWLVKLAAPLGFAAMITSLSVNVPRYFLEASHGRSALGYFAAVFYASIVIGRFVTALSEAMLARLASAYIADRAAFGAMFLRCVALVCALGFAAVAGSALAGGRFLAALYRPEYARFAGLLTVVMLYGTISGASTALTYALTATRRLGAQAKITTLSATVTLIASAVLIPRYGIAGAAWVLCGAATVEVVAGAIVLMRVFSSPQVVRPVTASTAA